MYSIVNTSKFNSYMDIAINLARKASSVGEVPVGCVIINRDTQKIVAKSYNLMHKNKNPIAHAEIIAINKACSMIGDKNLSSCDIYVTLEPCAMCAAAISKANIGRLFYGASDAKQGAVEHGVRFFTNKSCIYRPEIYIGFQDVVAKLLLQDFFKKIRENKSTNKQNN